MLVKLTVQAKATQVDMLRAICEVQFLRGGLVKAGEGGQFVHYLETVHREHAEAEWRRDFEVVACEEVALGPEGLAGLLADLTEESDASE